MSTNRILQVNQLVKKELGRIIIKEVDFNSGVLVTLTRVEVSANLIRAKVYISVIPEDKISQVLEILNQQIYFLQQMLNRRLKMRPIPKIMFVEEIATRGAGRVEELLEEIHHNKYGTRNLNS